MFLVLAPLVLDCGGRYGFIVERNLDLVAPDDTGAQEEGGSGSLLQVLAEAESECTSRLSIPPLQDDLLGFVYSAYSGAIAAAAPKRIVRVVAITCSEGSGIAE